MRQRGATEEEVCATIQHGERFPARFGRTGFRRNFAFRNLRRGRYYETKQLEMYAVKEHYGWIVITVVVKYF
jgi:hypothetical protein